MDLPDLSRAPALCGRPDILVSALPAGVRESRRQGANVVMSEPMAVAVMLVNGRAEMVKRAVASFRAQTYDRKKLLVWNTGERMSNCAPDSGHVWWCEPAVPGNGSVGALRNAANKAIGVKSVDIICHWDSDDWSHPRRIEEQVALLQSSGKACVGYNEMLFCDTRKGGAAWLYRNLDPRYMSGTSMCYWREAWEKCPFEDRDREDWHWWIKNAKDCAAVSSFGGTGEPRMIASIHDGNTSKAYDDLKEGKSWHRVPEWDAYCEHTMRLEAPCPSR